MATERNLSDLLPTDPAPRPARREEAIGAAMRRFDGLPDPTRQPAASRPRRIVTRPQLGGLVAVALIAAVGFPLWLSVDRTSPTSSISSNATVAMDAAPAPSSAFETARVAPPNAVAAPGRTEPDKPVASSRAEVEASISEMSAKAEAAAPAAPALASRFALVPAPPPPPAAAPSTAMAAADEAEGLGNIVVTGSRINGRAARARARFEQRIEKTGAWNACTVTDPRKSLTLCRRALRTDAAGPTGKAAALIAEGLTRAWQDDDDSAIKAFGRAIELAPKSGVAWLNRGIARAKAGDNEGALQDLDKAVRYAPRDARAWLQRSIVLRQEGKEARADADAARAVQLDPAIDRLFE